MKSAGRPPSWRQVEPTLPRVPLPTLERSCELFLQWCAPLLDSGQLAETERAVAAFLAPDSPAHVLQRALADHDAQPGVDSWLDRFWPSRYLGRRDRIALNADFFFLFPDDAFPDDALPRPDRDPQPHVAARLIAGTLAFHHADATDTLPAPTARGRSLSAAQTDFLFSATRIPGREIDSSRSPHTPAWPGPSRERHVVVLHHDTLWSLDVLDADGRPYAESAVADALAGIVAAGRDHPAGPGVGNLTTTARAAWARTRDRFAALDPTNAALLDAVERALFCVCLDDAVPSDALDAGDQLLHGHSGNRWYDKALSWVIFADGTSGVSVEHCNLDGTTVVRLVEDVLADAHPHRPDSPDVPPAPRRLDPVLDDGLRATIADAARDFAEYGAAMASTTLHRNDLGADAIKAQHLSPDAFMQLAYQVALHRTTGALGATYESIAMRPYRHGRTEAMRVVTPEIVAFVDALADPTRDADARAAAMRSAAAAHVARAAQCQAGDAPEQHLWELQLVQQREGARLGATGALALYDSPGWTIMRTDHLSTSSVPSRAIRYFGFGSTSPVCIGVGYALLPDRLSIYLSTPRTVEQRMHEFVRQLGLALDELLDLAAVPSP